MRASLANEWYSPSTLHHKQIASRFSANSYRCGKQIHAIMNPQVAKSAKSRRLV
jgi:hypothetical protein